MTSEQSTEKIIVGLIGTGAFGRSFLSQAQRSKHLTVRVVCDRDLAAAERACKDAGLKDQSVVCDTTDEAEDALRSNKIAIVGDGRMVAELPVSVAVECTGSPEAGATNARALIGAGKHVVMVSKETDVVVGPILGMLAAERGVTYALAQGDQPALLVDLISWAEALGLPISCAGKASEKEFLHPSPNGNRLPSKTDDLRTLKAGNVASGLRNRHELLGGRPAPAYDLCEMAIVMNNTGYGYDTPTLHAPIARMRELADVFCGPEYGGILKTEGVVDVFYCLRAQDDVSPAGGVFVVVQTGDQETWQMLQSKGHILNSTGSHAVLFRPYHLLGIETAQSVLAASRAVPSSRSVSSRPRVDLCGRTTTQYRRGQRIAMNRDHTVPGIAPEIHSANPSGGANPIPLYMAVGRTATRDIPPGIILTFGMVDPDPRSSLWDLRELQDERFFGPGALQ